MSSGKNYSRYQIHCFLLTKSALPKVLHPFLAVLNIYIYIYIYTYIHIYHCHLHPIFSCIIEVLNSKEASCSTRWRPLWLFGYQGCFLVSEDLEFLDANGQEKRNPQPRQRFLKCAAFELWLKNLLPLRGEEKTQEKEGCCGWAAHPGTSLEVDLASAG